MRRMKTKRIRIERLMKLWRIYCIDSGWLNKNLSLNTLNEIKHLRRMHRLELILANFRPKL
jgi:hypothetical protein